MCESYTSFQTSVFLCSFYVALIKMRLRTRKGSPRSSHGPAGRTARTKRKHSEEEEEEESSPLVEKLSKPDTGLLSTIKNFIKGSTTKVSQNCLCMGLIALCIVMEITAFMKRHWKENSTFACITMLVSSSYVIKVSSGQMPFRIRIILKEKQSS